RARWLLLALLFVMPDTGQAQLFNGKVNTENFVPGGGRNRIWSVEESLVAPEWQPYAHLLFYGERESLRVQVGRFEEVLVKFRTMADLNIGIGLWDVLQLEVALPAVLQWEQGETTQTVGAASGAAIGDVMVRLRATLLDNRAGGFGIGLSAGATFPTSTGDAAVFTGDPGIGGLANAIFDFRSPRVVLALNAGVRLRSESVQLLNETFEHDLTYGLGLDIAVWRGHVDLAMEIFGRTPLTDAFQSQTTTNLEVLGGPKWWMWDGLVLQAAAGAGLVRGYGAPDFRFTVGLAWAPKREDSDGDGLADDDDMCPMAPEDPDGYADSDGCPDDDNDGDGFDDENDKCPNEREDMNGVDDEDGCPDADSDGDGVADILDKCPTEREDPDGFADHDGCPELDNDGDGIQDTADKCPNKAEVRNGVDDEDGCPDEGGAGGVKTVVVEKIEKDDDCSFLLPTIYFQKARHVLRPPAWRAIKTAAARIKAHQASDKPAITEVRVEGHASQEGSDDANFELSQRRAEVVKAGLVKVGVASSLLSIRGFGEAAPQVDAPSAGGLPQNRRTGFTVTLGGKCKR
ncbi:MAG: outer membrane protein OmpA-like peptidoglycan-associated protein, partial [Myxococcota bacterium]